MLLKYNVHLWYSHFNVNNVPGEVTGKVTTPVMIQNMPASEKFVVVIGVDIHVHLITIPEIFVHLVVLYIFEEFGPLDGRGGGCVEVTTISSAFLCT